jgi:hypothetical protein
MNVIPFAPAQFRYGLLPRLLPRGVIRRPFAAPDALALEAERRTTRGVFIGGLVVTPAGFARSWSQEVYGELEAVGR